MINIKELKNNLLGIISGVGLLLGGATVTIMGLLIIITIVRNHDYQGISFGSVLFIAGLSVTGGGIRVLKGVKFNITI